MSDILKELQDIQNSQMGIVDGEVTKKSSFIAGINKELVSQINQENILRKKVPLNQVRKTLTEIIEDLYVQEEQKQFQEYMATERQVPTSIMHKAKGFFVPDWDSNSRIFGNNLRDYNLGLITDTGTPLYAGRFIYPVFGFNNEVLGLIGYDKFHQTKYLLSKTAGFGKSNMFYGMHLARWIYSQGYVLVVEGIVDCLVLWMLGYPAIGLNGNAMTDFTIRFLSRFDFNCILMPDNDETGEKAITFWKMKLPNASVLKVSGAKDFDAWRLQNNIVDFEKAVEKIKSSALIKMPLQLVI